MLLIIYMMTIFLQCHTRKSFRRRIFKTDQELYVYNIDRPEITSFRSRWCQSPHLLSIYRTVDVCRVHHTIYFWRIAFVQRYMQKNHYFFVRILLLSKIQSYEINREILSILFYERSFYQSIIIAYLINFHNCINEIAV